MSAGVLVGIGVFFCVAVITALIVIFKSRK